MTTRNRRRGALALATTCLTLGLTGAAGTSPAQAFICNPIDECEHVPLPVDPTGNCWVSVHAIIDYYDISGVRCVLKI